MKPSPAALDAAWGKTLPDVIAPGLRVLFCGINPSVYSAAVGHHFARPGNRFWKTLARAGFTPTVVAPDQDRELIALGLGITNVVARATASEKELSADDYRRGALVLARKVRRYRPATLAFVGIGAYRRVARAPKATPGLQAEAFAGARVWVLPNPSGLNAHYQLAELTRSYRALWRSS